jgi:hypothetical protein
MQVSRAAPSSGSRAPIAAAGLGAMVCIGDRTANCSGCSLFFFLAYKLSPSAPLQLLPYIDRTLYGRAAASPRSFIQHHSQRISRAAVMWDAEAIFKRVVTHKQEACLVPRPHPTTSVTVA